MPNTVTNATAVYAIMLLVFVAGMWAILAYGSTLRPQPDLAGEWLLVPEGVSSQETIRASFDQSGRFARLRLGPESFDLRVDERNASTSDESICLTGTRATARFDTTPAADVYRLTVQTPAGGMRRFTARLVSRTYPRESGATQQLHRKKLAQEQQSTRPASRP